MNLGFTDADFERDYVEGAGGHVAPSPWLERRRLHLGASETYTAMIALGRRDATAPQVPKWMLDKARLVGPWKAPRLFLQKAGLVPSEPLSSAARAGLEREREILAAWDGHPDVDDVRYAPDYLPREILPLVDRHCPALSCTPDAWGRDPFGSLVDIQVKASVAPGTPDPRPWYAVQVQAEMAVTGAEWGLLVTAWSWAAHWERDGEITHEVVERDERLIAEIRETAEESMAWVRKLRDGG